MNEDSNEVQRLLKLANHLGDLCEEMVFLGGAVLCLLIDDPKLSTFRPTKDIDFTAEIQSLIQFYNMQDRLKKLGFQEVFEEDSIICRYKKDEFIIDIVPTTSILGFTNIWYAAAFQHSDTMTIDNKKLRVISVPYFLASKIEAFKGRGQNDYAASHDIEDLIAVCDGRKDIIDCVADAPFDVKNYLVNEFKLLLKNDDFTDALPGHLAPDPGSQARHGLLEKRLNMIASLTFH
ncbi:MAG: hypothetical protein JXR91_06675 [Deltaproteobacteria bacterium]|nr:hypothetical protein [Deltaproteobacteria bacterium]